MNKYTKCATNLNTYLKNMFQNYENINIENNNNSSKFAIIVNNDTIHVDTYPTNQFYARDNIATIELKIRVSMYRSIGVYVHTYERLTDVIDEINKNEKWNNIYEKHMQQKTFPNGCNPIYYDDHITPQLSQKCSTIKLNKQH